MNKELNQLLLSLRLIDSLLYKTIPPSQTIERIAK